MKVRNIFRLFAFSLSLFTLVACSEKNEETITLGTIQTNVQEVLFEGLAAGQSQSIEFDAPEAWIAEIHSIGNWVKADKMHGDAGKSVITLSPRSDNFNVGMREAELEILVDGCEPCLVQVKQKSAATDDIQVEGLDENGVLNLQADETGTEFRDTLWVSSSKRWTLATNDQQDESIFFETDGEPRQGELTRIQVIVKVPYAKFVSSSYEGSFYITTEEGSAVPIGVFAKAVVGVYDTEYSMGQEPESTSFNLENSVQNGIFVTDCYVESNVRWMIGSMPDWVETSTAAGTFVNVLASGQINPLRQHIAFRVKENALSRDGKTGTVELVDAQGHSLKTIYLTFPGVGSSYIENRLYFPALDAQGNPFGFESKAANADASGSADNGKQIRREFDVITSSDYTSLSNAPFHLLLVRADNGIARQQEAHWASLEYVGRQTTSMQGLSCHRLALRANDRGDADDQNGLSKETEWRYAMVILVPRSVHFDDLWDEAGHLREKYANVAVLVAQKNNADADYTFGFEGVKNGDSLTVPAAGGSLTLHITPGSYTQCDILMEQQNKDGEWVEVDGKTCQMDVNVDEQMRPTAIVFTLSHNKGEENPFTHQIVGSSRHIRVSVNAFLGEEEGSKTIFMFYIDQELDN